MTLTPSLTLSLSLSPTLTLSLFVLQIHERELLGTNDFIKLSVQLQHLGRGFFDAEQLLHVAFRSLVQTPSARRALSAAERVHSTVMAVTVQGSDAMLEHHARHLAQVCAAPLPSPCRAPAVPLPRIHRARLCAGAPPPLAHQSLPLAAQLLQ